MDFPLASPSTRREALIGPHHEAGTSRSKLIIIMVGLPASGKSYIAKKLCRYLNWLQHKTLVFNVGDRRRTSSSASDATFFDPSSPACVSFRDRLALDTLDELLEWLDNDQGDIGILDATNSTFARRELLLTHIRLHQQQQHAGKGAAETIKILFLESRCADKVIREANIRLKLSGPDYAGKDATRSLADFRRRVAHYEKAYEPLGDVEEDRGYAFVSMTDAGRKMNTHLIRGYITSQTVEYLLNFNLARRRIWLSCHGESLEEIKGRVGLYSDLSERGKRYASALATFVHGDAQQQQQRRSETTATTNGTTQTHPQPQPQPQPAPSSSRYCIWTSTWPQAVQTGQSFPNVSYDKTATKMLDDLNAGTMAGLTVEEIMKRHPDEYAARRRDKLLYRWPGLGGEGYVDLIVRLRPLILELERTTDNIVLITHRAVVRVLITYFLGIQRDDLGGIQLPKDTVYCFDIEPYGIIPRPFAYNPDTGTFNQISNSDLPFMSNR
ncbi:6-phosphofructo-2-kinase-domain-containing protein [Poronia punctata]|nr:6-phosphofructo-2-kinase-domain-containing protein [Poronia punctata]